MKKFSAIVAALAAAFIITSCASDPNKVINQALSQAAEMINTQAPILVSDEVRIDSARALPGKKIIFYYNLQTVDKEGIEVDELTAAIKPQVLEMVQDNPMMSVFRKQDITIIFNYTDKNGEEILNYEVTPEMYK